jgi:oligosaccharide repeat unit polymerase
MAYTNNSLERQAQCLWLALIIAISGSLVMAAIVAADHWWRAVIIVGNIVALSLPFCIRVVQNKFTLYEPLVLANTALGVMFVGRPVGDLLTHNTIHVGLDITAGFDTALIATLVAIIGFELGYFSHISQYFTRILRMGKGVNVPRALPATLVLALLSLGLFSIFIVTNGGIFTLISLLAGRQAEEDSLFRNSTSYLYSAINGMFPAGLTLYGIAVVRKSTKLKMCGWLAAAVPTLFYLGRGDRSILITALAFPIFRALYLKRKLRLTTFLVVATMAICTLGVLREFRTVSVREDAAATKSKIGLINPIDAALDIINGNDAEMFDSMANMMPLVPEEYPFHPGGTLLSIPIRILPRVLFPNKPLELNEDLYATLWPDHFAKTRAGFALSIVGPFYADSWFFGVFVGMFVVGVIFRGMWRWFQANSDSFWAAAIYSIALPYTVNSLRGTVTDALAGSFFTVMPLIVIAKIAMTQSLQQRSKWQPE